MEIGKEVEIMNIPLVINKLLTAKKHRPRQRILSILRCKIQFPVPVSRYHDSMILTSNGVSC